MNAKRLSVLAVALLVGAAFCAGANAAAKDTLTVGTGTFVKSLDPVTTNDIPSSTFQAQMYESLFSINRDKKLVGQLAAKWKKVDDRTYEFELRKGVKFHNGEEMTAEDAVFSLHRMTEPVAAAAKSYGDLLDPNGFKVIDKYTFQMKSATKMGTFLPYLSLSCMSILNKKAVLAAGADYAKKPIGTGPFKYVGMKRGDSLTFERFEGYWNQKAKPEFKTLIFRTIPEANSRVIELETGNIDLAFGIPVSDFDRLEKEKKVDVFHKPGLAITYLGMHCGVKPFDNPKVRRAISMAINKKEAVQAAYSGHATIPTSPLLPINSYYRPDAALEKEYNPTLAKKMLDEAGVKDLSFSIVTNGENKQRMALAEIIQEQLSKLGISVKVEGIEWATFLDRLRAGKLPVFIIGWGSSNVNPDPSAFIDGAMLSKFAGASNRVWLKDAKVDELLTKGQELEDGPEREKVYVEFQKRVNDICGWCYLCNADSLYGCRKGLVGPADFYQDTIVCMNVIHFPKK